MDWDERTLTLVQANGVYGRMARLRGGEIACSFDLNRRVCVRHSRDDGKTWGDPVPVAAWPHGVLTNAELLRRSRDGALLCFYNARPDPNSGEPFQIGLAIGDAAGRMWQPATILFRAGTEFSNGCWEPAAIELPGGEIQLFFANEAPYRSSDEQEITRMRSPDGGRTWSAPERAIFRPRARDGMPVPIVLRATRTTIAVAIEDNGLSGNFKPVIVTLRGGDDATRAGALRTPLAPNVYAGAPYLRQMPGGQTILSFQRSDSGDLKNARMVVCVGDAEARNFGDPTFPFPQEPGSNQLWNALFVKDARTVTAISQTRIGGVQGIWAIDGHV